MHSSTFLVFNEINAVLNFKVVPNDTRNYVTEIIEQIYDQIPVKDRMPMEFFFTDNVLTDTRSIQELGKKLFPERKHKVFVLQDIWHAQQRVIAVLHKGHPDYGVAVSSIKKIFSQLPDPLAYPRCKDFEEALNKWRTQFSRKVFGKIGVMDIFSHFSKYLCNEHLSD